MWASGSQNVHGRSLYHIFTLIFLFVFNTMWCKVAGPAFCSLTGIPFLLTWVKKNKQTARLQQWHDELNSKFLLSNFRAEKIETISEITSDVWVAATSSLFVLHLLRPCQERTTSEQLFSSAPLLCLWLHVALCCSLISYDRTLSVCVPGCVINWKTGLIAQDGWQRYLSSFLILSFLVTRLASSSSSFSPFVHRWASHAG